MTDPPCDLCGAQRALVFCASDAACLCLPCDHQVHSANPLSHRHLRAPLCDRCRRRNSPVPPRPAAVRCPDCGLSCCIACELGCPGPDAGHRSARYVVPYSGCPSPAELSIVLDSSGTGVGTTMTTPINDKCDSTCWDEDPRVAGVDGGKQHQGVLLYKESKLNMLSNPLCNDVGLGDSDELREGFNSVEVDGFHMENMDEILEWWKDGGQNGLFMEDYNTSIANSNSNGHIDNTLEASTSIQTDWASLPSVSGSLHAVDINADQLVLNLNCTRNNTLSSLTGESSILADYQECRAPPMFLVGDSPWDSNHDISSTPEARNEAKMRYNEKKKSRLFGKQIRYASRKARADTRKRVRGRFVKAGEAYDYDPLEAKR